jgi:hypothetical protein
MLKEKGFVSYHDTRPLLVGTVDTLFNDDASYADASNTIYCEWKERRDKELERARVREGRARIVSLRAGRWGVWT